MAHFVVMIDGQYHQYTNYEDIPERIDAVLKFLPDFPEPPHTEEEHKLAHMWEDRFNEVIGRIR